MSHVAAIDCTIDPSPAGLKALAAACPILGLVFKRDQKTHAWYGRWVNDYAAADAAYKNGIKPEDYGKCLHAIQLPGCKYEIGVVARPDGKGLTLIYDFWGPGQQIVDALGKGCEKLKQQYGVQHAMGIAKSLGHFTKQITTESGAIKLQITGLN